MAFSRMRSCHGHNRTTGWLGRARVEDEASGLVFTKRKQHSPGRCHSISTPCSLPVPHHINLRANVDEAMHF